MEEKLNRASAASRPDGNKSAPVIVTDSSNVQRDARRAIEHFDSVRVLGEDSIDTRVRWHDDSIDHHTHHVINQCLTPCREGWLYLTVILDLASRRVVGWATSALHDSALVTTVLHQAVAFRVPKPRLVSHSDRGRIYAGAPYQQTLAHYKLVPSMSRRTDGWDNAVVESFFATLAREL